MSATGKVRFLEGGRLAVFCPACHCHHYVDAKWTYNGNPHAPTFSPSILVTGSQFRPDGTSNHNVRCHSFLTDGVWHYCGDSAHEYAGQSLPAPDQPVDSPW